MDRDMQMDMDMALRYGPNAEFGCAPWEATRNQLIRYWPLRKLFVYVPWTKSQNLVVNYGHFAEFDYSLWLLHRIWFCSMSHSAEGRLKITRLKLSAMGHCGGFDYALWARAENH
jgi:hypothetical protein